MSDYFILEGHIPVACDFTTWTKSRSGGPHPIHVGLDDIGPARVSTVFLGLDHNFGGDGPPILFETMVFGGPLTDEMERYVTWDEAAAGHKAMCERVRTALS